MRLDDEQIERYSRQLILQEVGPRGQERLLASRVAVVGTDAAAAHVVAYLAAAGVGAIAADPALHAAIDPRQADCTVGTLATAPAVVDALIVSAASGDSATERLAAWRGRSSVRFWIAAGHAGSVPPCPTCALADRAPHAAIPAFSRLYDATLGSIVATETVKSLIGIGVPLTGHVLAYDVATATLERRVVRKSCACAETV